MKNKKILAMMLCAAMAASFTACGTQTDTETETEDEVSVYDDVWDGNYNGEELLNTDQNVDTESYSFTKTNQNGLVIDGATVTFGYLSINKKSDRSRIKDAAVTKGLGASALVKNGRLEVNEGNIVSDAAGASGVFSYAGGDINLYKVNVSTSGVYSPGVACAAGGDFLLDESTIHTEGRESAGLSCVDKESYMNIMNSSIETKGKNSPGVYLETEADFKTSQITAYSSEAMRFNGVVSTWIEECELTGNKTGSNANDFNWTILACADEKLPEGTSADIFFNNTSITSHSGGMFYATNTRCGLYVDNCELTNSGDDGDFLLRCQGNNDLWGRKGSNGAVCNFTLSGTQALGDVYYDSTSELNMQIMNETVFTGSIKKDEKFAGDGGDGHCIMGVQDGSRWIVTDNSEVDTLECNGDILDEKEKAVAIVGRDGTIYQHGDSEYTVTVGSYTYALTD